MLFQRLLNHETSLGSSEKWPQFWGGSSVRFRCIQFVFSVQFKFCLLEKRINSALISVVAEKNYVQARYHFLHSSDGEGCAAMLIEYHVTLGYPSEVDLFIAQAVLQ